MVTLRPMINWGIYTVVAVLLVKAIQQRWVRIKLPGPVVMAVAAWQEPILL